MGENESMKQMTYYTTNIIQQTAKLFIGTYVQQITPVRYTTLVCENKISHMVTFVPSHILTTPHSLDGMMQVDTTLTKWK